MIGRVAVAAALLATLGGCGGDAESDPLGIGLIAPAIEAVREEIGRDPRFFEINSTSDGVTLFLQDPDTTTDGGAGVRQVRFTAENGLVVAEDVMPASGAAFGVPDWVVSPEELTAEVFAELPRSEPLMFVMTASVDEASSTTGDIVLRVLMESEMGGRLAVFVDRDGRILGTDVIE